jgi:tetratricopeptide (TPR) repeat protein
MLNKTKDDDLVMSLVDLALTHPVNQREAYLRSACGGDTELFNETWTYVQWEQRMQGFLLDPLFPPSSYEHPFEPGELLDDRFRIVREIAQGGMGVVYEAVDEKLQRRIALKCAKTGFRKRLPPEVRNATEISHPNVCKIFEIHTASTGQGEIDFITMEFLDGETLADRLTRGPLPEKEARAIALQLCAGLAEAHRKQVIHGDLKSNNVILTSGPHGAVRAVITDFGLARGPEAAQATAQSGQMAGTPDYMAPELWKGAKASVASDIYALGVIFSQLGSGRLQNRIVARCLLEDPASRFPNADAIAQALQPLRSRRWLLAAAAAAILAVITGVVTYQRATAPKKVVRLVMLPFSYSADLAPLADGVFREASANLAKLRGGTNARYSAISIAELRRAGIDTPEKAKSAFKATHVLHGSLAKEKDQIVLHAFLTDTRTGVDAKEWTMEYGPGQTRYIPVALAGFVTGTLHLPPLAIAATMNASAQSDYKAGSLLLRRDKTIDAALAAFERAVTADPDSALAYAGLAEAQWFKYGSSRDSDWFARAAESTNQAQRRNPDLAPVLFVKGAHELLNSWYEQAIAEFQRALEIDPGYSDALRYLGAAHQQLGQPELALAAYRQAMRADPDNYRSYVNLGNFYIQRDQYSQALEPLKKAVALAPEEPDPRYYLAGAYMSLGQFQAAETELRIALSSGETVDVLDTLGTTLMYQRQEENAIPFYKRTLAIDPKNYWAWTNLGICYRRLNRPKESEEANRSGLEAAEAAKQQNPRRGYTRAFAAYLHARLGHRQLAEQEISQAMTFSPDGSSVRWMAVLTYGALGEDEAALSILGSASPELLADLNRWPDLAELQRDPRFIQLLVSKHVL